MGDYSATIQKLGAANDQANALATGTDGPALDAPEPAGPYSDTIRMLGDSRKQAAQLAVVAAQGANPDAAGRAAQLAPQVGVPAAAVEQDLPAFEQQAQTQRNAAIVSRNPVLAGWLAANPESARIAKDDFDKLDVLSKAFTALSSGWSEAFLSNERGRLGNLAMLGSTDTSVPGRIQGIEDKLQGSPQLQGIYGTMKGAASFAGGMLDNFMHAAPVVNAGMATGAVAGGAGGAAVGGIGAVPGALGGAVVGGALGAWHGLRWDAARSAAGNTYLNLGKITGADGQPIDEGAKQAASVLVGIGTYALMGVGGASVKAEATEAASKFLSDAVAQAVTQPTVARAITLAGQKIAKSGMEGALLNAGMEGTNIFGEETAKLLSSGQFDTVFNDPLQRQQALDRLMSAAVDGAMLFPIMKLPFIGASFAGDAMRARQAVSDVALFQGLEQGAASSKVRGRSMGAFQDFLQRQAQGSPVENLFIPGARVRELYQSMGGDPGGPKDPFDFVPDMKEQLDQSKATGGDVVIPTADYVAHLAGTPLADELRPDIRVRQDGMSAREAAEFEKHRSALLADNAVSLRTQMDDELRANEPAAQVNADMFSKLRTAGYTVDVARQYAALMGARYATRAERLEGKQGSALDLYKAEGVDVRRVLPASLAHVPVDESDMVINAVRDRSKMPSDKELFGPSLVDFIKDRGGVIDDAGELKALDADKVRGLVKNRAKGEVGNDRTLDATTLAAWEDGYFPEHAERPEIGDLTEAIRAELGGDKRYAGGSADDARAAFKAAVEDMDQFVNEKGLDLKTASNADVKAALRQHQGEQGGGREFAQAARGKITLDNAKAIISLFRDADLSTFLHEIGHLWLDELARDASGDGAPPALRDDLNAVLKWLKVESADQIGTEQHEQFARGFEAYLMEGRAPSLGLATAFRKFKTWLVAIYKGVAGLKVPMNDQIRGVMDRLVATEHEIAGARRAEGLNPIFPDAKSAGMTDAEYRAYTQGIKKAQTTADERLLKSTMAAIRRSRTAAWKEEAASMHDDVSREVKSRPDLRAQYFLRTGKLLDAPEQQAPMGRVRMSRAALKDMYGNDEAPGLLPKGTYSNTGGIHPDELADLFGYASGDKMVKALMSLEATRKSAEAHTGKALDGSRYIAHLIDGETEARMLERHGDALSDGSIEEEALAAVHNQAQADVMATELRMLARKAATRGEREEPPLGIEDIHAWVRGEISGMKVDRGTDTAGFGRAEAKAGRDVERALLAGDFRAAFEAKQRQIVNHLFSIEADAAREEYQDGRKLFERYASKATFAGIDQGYTDRIHELLKRFGYDTKRSDAELKGGLGNQTLEGFVGAKEAEGRELAVASFLLDDRFAKPIADLTVDEFGALADAVRSLAHNGRDEKMITVEGKRMELDGLVGEAVDKLATMPQRKAPKEINPGTASGFRGTLERLSSLMRRADAGLLKEEQVFDWLDGRDPNGVFNRVVFRRLKEAQHRENDRLADVTARVKALGDAMPNGWQRGLNERMEVHELPDKSGEPYTFRKKDILALALNTGNDSNFDKLVKGYGWSRDSVKAVLARTMKKEDWDFVQGIWDTFESLYPDIEAMTRRITGVGPEKVTAVAVDTPHGSYRGGYYPVVYDPLKSHAAELRGQRSAAAMFENNYFRATTPKGHTLARVENYAAQIKLSLDIIPWKLGQAVHDLSFREAIMDADKFLTDKRIRAAVDNTLGHEYTMQFRKWLQSIANDRNIDEKGLAGMDWLARQARINTTMVGVGFRVSTMMKHGMTALSNSIGEIGAKAMTRGAAEFFGSPEKMRRQWDFAIERSGELRHRMNQIDRDVREGLRTLEGETGWRAAAERYGHYGVAMLDMGSALPTWFGAYRKALDGGALESDAVYAADKSVRNAHGAQGVTDIAQIQRGGEVAKLFTMFYGFFNHIYNRQRDTLRIAGEGGDKFKAGDYAGARRDFSMVLARSVYYLIVPALVEALVSQGGPDEDKEETWGGWAAKAIAGEIPAGIPLLRDAAKAAIDGRSYEMSPVGKAVETAIALGKDVGSALGMRGDKEPSSRWVKHAIETPGYVFGLPTGQLGGTAQYLWDVWNQDTAPEGIADFMRGVMYGPAPKKP